MARKEEETVKKKIKETNNILQREGKNTSQEAIKSTNRATM